MVTAQMLAEIVRPVVAAPGERVTSSREYPDGPAVDLEVADRSYSVRVRPDWLVADQPWVDVVVMVRRDDLDHPPPPEFLLVPVDGPVLRLADEDVVAGLGTRVFDGSLAPEEYAQILVGCQWPVDGPKQVILDPDEWRADLPPGVSVAAVGGLVSWLDEGLMWLSFFASCAGPDTYRDPSPVEVHHWTVRIEPDDLATWGHLAVPPEATELPPRHRGR